MWTVILTNLFMYTIVWSCYGGGIVFSEFECERVDLCIELFVFVESAKGSIHSNRKDIVRARVFFGMRI